MLNVLHLADDTALGGVMVALRNFEDPRLASLIRNDVEAVDSRRTLAPALSTDVIIIHFTVSWAKIPFLASLRARNPGAQIILVEHTYTQGFCKHNVSAFERFRLMLRLSYACVDKVVAVSRAQGFWLRSLGLGREVIDIPQSRPLSGLVGAVPSRPPRERVVFGAIGRFHKQKGFDNLLIAFNHPDMSKFDLVLAGYGEDEAMLRSLAAGNRNIRFMGKVADPAEFYATVDCVVVPSRWEAFGLVASEAIAAGKYVIASRVDGLTEQIVGTGHSLTSSDDPMALRRDLQRTGAMSRQSRDMIVANTRHAVSSRYDAMIESWQFVFSLVSRKRGREVKQLVPMPA